MSGNAKLIVLISGEIADLVLLGSLPLASKISICLGDVESNLFPHQIHNGLCCLWVKRKTGNVLDSIRKFRCTKGCL